MQIVWREDLLRENEAVWEELTELMPPVQREALAMPLGAVRRWLKQQEQEIADIEGVELDAPKDEKREALKQIVRWRSGEEKIVNANDLRPGDTIIVPSFYGGADEFGWNPKTSFAAESFTPDIADVVNADDAQKGVRRRCIRLDIAAKMDSELTRLLTEFRTEHEPDIEGQIVSWLGPAMRGAKLDRSGRIATGRLKARDRNAMEPATDETDETDDSSLTDKRSLAAHTAGVVEHAKRFAAGCGISAELASDIHLAARLHDWGKCDERFQAWLVGKPFDHREYLAKSGGNRSAADSARLRAAAGYPDKARHEAGSVVAACASGLLSEAHDPDLVLHLIGTHHGYGRPLFPVWDDPPGFTVTVGAEGRSFETSSGKELALIDSGWADRFALLNRRYGYWGLAYLEAILRRADCMQSRREERDGQVNAHGA